MNSRTIATCVQSATDNLRQVFCVCMCSCKIGRYLISGILHVFTSRKYYTVIEAFLNIRTTSTFHNLRNRFLELFTHRDYNFISVVGLFLRHGIKITSAAVSKP